jgi:ATP adenylyltransferase/5',5'''-P-1,P-4-tetraphosphate phosphorylase II
MSYIYKAFNSGAKPKSKTSFKSKKSQSAISMLSAILTNFNRLSITKGKEEEEPTTPIKLLSFQKLSGEVMYTI